MKVALRRILLALVCVAGFSVCANAQFKEQAFTQNYNEPNDTTAADTADVMFSFKQFFRGIAHKQTIKIGTMFAGSTIFVGSEQIYNKQYWKLPLVYGGLGATVGLGIHYHNMYNDSKRAYDADYAINGTKTTLSIDNDSKKMSQYLFAGAAAIYWATLMDGVINYDKGIYPQPGKATLYSVLLPGLGQVYNHEYWKIPIYWGGLIGSYHYYSVNNKNYRRYKRIYNEATSNTSYSGPVSSETALYYRNVFRRYRDYSIVCIAGFYLLQAIDANVFAYMHDFDVGNDLTLEIEPTLTPPGNAFAFSPNASGSVGFSIELRF